METTRNHLTTIAPVILLVVILMPGTGFAQSSDWADSIGGFTEGMRGLHGTITNMYQQQKGQMGGMIRAVSTILALGIVFYIFSRIWRSLLAAEPIDFWSLLKPIGVFFLVLSYPVILQLTELCLSPINGVTETMNFASYERMIEARKRNIRNSEEYQMYIGDDGEGKFEEYYEKYKDGESDALGVKKMAANLSFAAEGALLKMQYKFKMIIAELLRLFYEAAILCINFIRTFYLIILAILGPIAFALMIFPGFSNMPFHWLGQFISKWLWLPIANILATMLNTIQEQMIITSETAGQIGDSGFFSPTDFSNLVFLLIGIVAFFCVPSVASMAVQVSGAAAGALNSKFSKTGSTVQAAAGIASGGVGTAVQAGKMAVSKGKEAIGSAAARIRG